MTHTAILEKLVSFPILGGESNLEIINWIQKYIDSHGVQTHLAYNFDKTKASIHCRIGPAVDGGLILSGHTDVVPVGGQDWTSDPFKLRLSDGKLYGRGSCDMKGFLALCLSLLPKMTSTSLTKPIYLAFSYDEEIGCLALPELTDHIKNTYEETPKYAIIGEPTLLKPIVGQKGICLFETTIEGSTGHSSRIYQEVSAIHEGTHLVNWLVGKMERLKNTSNDDRFIPSHSSIHIGKFSGGIAHNIIAQNASFQWDVRTIPQDSMVEIVQEFKVYCQGRMIEGRKRCPSFSIKTETLHKEVPPLSTSKDSGIVALMHNISDFSTLDGVAYASEAGQYANAGYESMIFGPGSIQQAHIPDEYIEESQLNKGMQILVKLIDIMSKPDFK